MKGTNEEAMDGKYERRAVGHLIPEEQFDGGVRKIEAQRKREFFEIAKCSIYDKLKVGTQIHAFQAELSLVGLKQLKMAVNMPV